MKRTIRVLLTIAAAGLTLGACGDEDSDTGSPDPTQPAPTDVTTTLPEEPTDPDPDDGVEVRTIDPEALGRNEAAIDHYVTSETGTQIRWWSGVEPCTVLADVVVTESDSEVTIQVFQGDGTPPTADVGCVDIAIVAGFDVVLDEPLGDRVVVDATTGEPVPEGTDIPGLR